MESNEGFGGIEGYGRLITGYGFFEAGGEGVFFGAKPGFAVGGIENNFVIVLAIWEVIKLLAGAGIDVGLDGT